MDAGSLPTQPTTGYQSIRAGPCGMKAIGSRYASHAMRVRRAGWVTLKRIIMNKQQAKQVRSMKKRVQQAQRMVAGMVLDMMPKTVSVVWSEQAASEDATPGGIES